MKTGLDPCENDEDTNKERPTKCHETFNAN